MKYSGNSSFLFVSGMVRALEKRRPGRDIIESMLRAETEADAVNILKNTVYSPYTVSGEGEFSIEGMIKSMRGELYGFIDRYSFNTGAGELFRLDYDYHNMKVLLKELIFPEFRGVSLSGFGILDPELMREIFSSEEYNRLPDVMQHAVSSAIESYYVIKRHAVIDLVFDRYLLIDLLGRGSRTGSDVVANYFRRKVDAVNIMNLLRIGGKKEAGVFADFLFTDGGFIESSYFREGAGEPLKALSSLALKYDLHGIYAALDESLFRVYAVERECRLLMLRELEPADYMITGIEPLFAYGCRVDDELKTAGMILLSKAPGFDRAVADASTGRTGGV